MTERELIDGCLRRNAVAEKRFFERFSGMAMGVCRRYGTSYAEAQDMHQEGFVRCYLTLGSYSGQGSLEGWVRRVFVNNCLDELRRRKRLLALSDPLDTEIQIAAPESNAFLQEADAAHLVAAIASLPEGARVVFNLYAVEGFNHAEIGKLLSITESASRAQLTRARALLRLKLSASKVQS